MTRPEALNDEAISYAFTQTQGQPWLVNALTYQECFRDVQDRKISITKEVMEKAREALIKRCDTHMDALLDRLNEPRVRNIMDILLSIYQEIIPRALAYTRQEEIMQEGAWHQKKDGLLDVEKLLTEFTKFYREHSEA